MLFLRLRLLVGVAAILTTLYLLYLGHYNNIGAFLQHSQAFILTFGTVFFGILGLGMFKLSEGLCTNSFNNGHAPLYMTSLSPCVVSYLSAALSLAISVGLFVQLLPGIFHYIRNSRKMIQK